MLIKQMLSTWKMLISQSSLGLFVACIGLVLLLAGCAQPVEVPASATEQISPPAGTDLPASVTPIPSEIASPTARLNITRIPPTPLPTELLIPPLLAGTPSNEMEAGPDHPAVQAAVEALSDQLGIQPEEIELVSSTYMEWPDSCLGLAGPGEMCLQVITPGYRVVLSVDGKQYAFRTDSTGGVVRMELLVGPAKREGQGS